MKGILLALCLAPLPCFAFTVKDAQLVQVLDGNVVTCVSPDEVGKITYAAVVDSAAASGQNVAVSLSLNFTTCVFAKNSYSYQPRLPLDPAYTRDDHGQPVRLGFSSADLLLTNFTDTTVAALNLANASPQTLAFNFPLSAALEAADQKLFNSGKPVRARLSLIERALTTAYPSGQDPMPLGWQIGGTYTLFLTVQK